MHQRNFYKGIQQLINRKMVSIKLLSFILAIFFAASFVNAISISINYPVEAANYNSNQTYINWTSYVSNASNCWFILNGGTNTPFNCDDYYLTNNINSIEGNNTWIIYVNNSESSIQSKTVNFYVDSIAPVLSYVNPSSSIGYTNSNTLNLQIKGIEDNLADYGDSSFIVKRVFSFPIAGSDTDFFDLDESNNADCSLTLASPREGNYTWIAYARDKYPDGTIIREINLTGTIIRDTIKPNIFLTSPLNGQNLSGNISISASASDERSGLSSILLNVSQGSQSNATICSSSPCNFNWMSSEFTDGPVNITATSTDRAGNINSTSITVEIDNTAPQIYFNSPSNGTYNESQIINITASDAHLANITLYINSNPVNTTNSAELIYTITSGNSVYAIACDTFGNCNNSETRSIIIDVDAPTITLTGANPQIIELGSNYTELGATAEDNINGNVTAYITIDNSQVDTSNIGTYYVFYTANDSVNNVATINRTVIINDTTAPEAGEITGPENNEPYGNETSLDFTINSSDYSNDISCYLTLNSEDYAMESGYGLFSVHLPSEGYFDAGQYFRNITCVDGSGNSNTTETLSFTILPELSNPDNFEDYTNLTNEEDISNVLYFFVGNQFGSINWTEAIDFSRGFDWSLFINLSDNYIEVNSTEAPELNKKAVITIYNLTMSNPRILKNGAVCSSPECNIISYINGTLIFNVTGFSAYSAEETPSNPSSGGGGSGHSSCYTNWTCSEWSSCIEGQQTRTCSKINNLCIAEENEPSEVRECSDKNQSTIESQAVNESENQKIKEESSSGSGFPGITGAAIGSNIKGGITFALLVIGLAVISLLVVRTIRKRGKNDIASRILLKGDAFAANREGFEIVKP
jgi:hypothetical protein